MLPTQERAEEIFVCDEAKINFFSTKPIHPFFKLRDIKCISVHYVIVVIITEVTLQWSQYHPE